METNENFIYINKEDIEEELKDSLEKGDLCKAAEAISKFLENLENFPLNIAVTGETGSGKSTFINAIRGLDDDDEEAAETGVVETTEVATPYAHPNDTNVICWDLPGVGTRNFKPNEYLEKVNFTQFDFFLIMASERFRLNNANLAKEIQAMGKKFYFVRTKVDSDLYSSKQRKKKTFNEQNILDEIRDNCIQSLQREGIHKPRVFLLSSLQVDKYDFNLMQDTLMKELPSMKRDVFLMALLNLSMSVLERKREALKKGIWKWAALSCAGGAVPIPGSSVACDVAIVTRAMNEYITAFGLNKESLEKLARQCGKDDGELRSVIKSPLVLGGVTVGAISGLLTKGVLWKCALRLIPGIGSVAAGGVSFVTISAVLKPCLEEIAEDAVRVLKVAFDTNV